MLAHTDSDTVRLQGIKRPDEKIFIPQEPSFLKID
jgi:hypothetical protein